MERKIETQTLVFFFAFLAALISCFFLFKKNRVVSSVRKKTCAIANKKIIDLGKIKWNVPVQIIYIIYNTGQENLFVETVQPDCHCTVVHWSKFPVKPEDSTSLKVFYNPSLTGIFQHKIIVKMNTDSEYMIFTLKGKAVY